MADYTFILFKGSRFKVLKCSIMINQRKFEFFLPQRRGDAGIPLRLRVSAVKNIAKENESV